MAGYCAPFDPAGAFLPEVIASVDCRARTLGQEGYLALSEGQLPLGLALTGLLTIYVAFIGYRLLLGEGLSVRQTVLIAVRLGLVLALATQWAAYRLLIYDVVTRGPAELASSIGGSEVMRPEQSLEYMHGVHRVLAATAPIPRQSGSAGAAQATSAPPTEFQAEQVAETQAGARQVFAATVLAAALVGPVVAGILLALGPLFIAALLFNGMRGLFEGWVRALGATILIGIGSAIILDAQLSILVPQATSLVELWNDGRSGAVVIDQIYSVTALFALLLLATIAAASVAAFGFRLPDAAAVVSTIRERLADTADTRTTTASSRALSSAIAGRTHAVSVSQAAGAMIRREEATASSGATRIAIGSGGNSNGTTAVTATGALPLGQRHRRTAGGRGSATAARRDLGR
jgi:type IV secretion system protein VirB6